MTVDWFVVRYFTIAFPIMFVVASLLAIGFAHVMTALTGSPYVVPPVCP